MHACDKGLVLRAVPYRDADMMLTILTQEQGKISAAARGVRRKSSRMSAAVQTFAYSEFTFFETQGRYTVNEAEAIELFFNLRGDISKLALASYFGELLELASDSDMINPEILRLGLNTFFALSERGYDIRALKSAFELRIAAYSGYAPVMGKACNVCKKSPINPCILLSDGSVCCDDCTCQPSVRVDGGVIDAIEHILNCDLKRIFSFNLGDESLDKLSRFSEAYICAQFDRKFKTLDFYKSIS